MMRNTFARLAAGSSKSRVGRATPRTLSGSAPKAPSRVEAPPRPMKVADPPRPSSRVGMAHPRPGLVAGSDLGTATLAPTQRELEARTKLLESDGLRKKLADRVREFDPSHELADAAEWVATNRTCAAIVDAALSEAPEVEKTDTVVNLLGAVKNVRAQVQCTEGLVHLITEAANPVTADWTLSPLARVEKLSADVSVTLICAPTALSGRRVDTGLLHAPVDDATARRADRNRIVNVVYGESGAGKTMLSVGIAAKLNAAAAVFFTPEAADREIPVPGVPPPNDGNAIRNAAAVEYVRKVVGYSIPKGYRRPHVTRHRPFVLILDGYGQYPDFVRGLIAAQQKVRATIRDMLRLADHTPVVLIVTRTGVDGLVMAPGSKASEHELHRAAPRVWDVVSSGLKSPAVAAYVNTDPGPIAAGVRALVSNARCAALFVDCCNTLLSGGGFQGGAAWPGLIPQVLPCVVQQTIARFRDLSGIRGLSLDELLRVFLQSLAAQHTVEDLEGAFAELNTTLGTVVDHARWDGRLELPADGLRYEVAPAYEAMLLQLLGLGERPPSGEGFGEALADFVQLCVMSATCDGVSECIPARVGGGADQAYLPQPPGGWRMPLDLVQWLRALGASGRADTSAAATPAVDADWEADAAAVEAAVNAAATAVNAAAAAAAKRGDHAAARSAARAAERAGATVAGIVAAAQATAVATYHWPHPMSAAQSVRPMREALACLSLEQLRELHKFHAVIAPARKAAGGKAAILINGGNAPWADIVAAIAGTLVLIQAKRHTSATLRAMDVMVELHTMGCRAPIVVLGKWLDANFPPSKAPVHAPEDKAVAAVFGDTPYIKRTATLEALAAKLRADGQGMLGKMRRLPGWGPLAEPAPCGVQVAPGDVVADVRGLKRAYVVAAVGNVEALGPAVLEQLGAETESPVLLLHSPLEVARGHRLRGYYPVPVAYEAPFSVSSAP
jgi:hypothetical protein